MSYGGQSKEQYRAIQCKHFSLVLVKLHAPYCLAYVPSTCVIPLRNPLCAFRFLPAAKEMLCYNAVIADARMPSATDLQARCSILSPELALPSGSHATTTRSHGALHILGNPLH